MNLDRPSTHSKLGFEGLLLALVALCVLLAGLAAPAHGQAPFFTLLSDGFGDGDLNNDGVALDVPDARQGSYIPDNYGTLDGPPDPTDMEDPTGPTETGPRIPSLQQEVDGGTLVLDSSDVGIRWFGASQFGSSGVSESTARLDIVHDTTAPVPVDMLDPFSRFPETLGSAAAPTPIGGQTPGVVPVHIPALDTGLALSVEASGSGNSATGFFPETIGLGDVVGDQLRVGFDFRIWASSPNDPGNPVEDPVAPTAGELRFGLYGDTAGHIGQTNPTAGQGGTPAVFGEEDGNFRDASPGAGGAEGYYVEVPIGDVTNPRTDLFFDAEGSEARIREDFVAPPEPVINPATGEPIINPFTGQPNMTAPQRFLTSEEFTVAAGNADPGAAFPVLNNVDTHRIELTLERAELSVTDAITMETTDFIGIRTTLETTNLQTGEVRSLTGFEPPRDFDGDGVIDDDAFFTDQFDYVGILGTGTSGGVFSSDYDFIIDNFIVDITGSQVPDGLRCDADGGSECTIADLDSLYAAFGTSVTPDSGFDYTGDGVVGPEDILGWLDDASVSTNTANPSGLTYVLGDANLDGSVNSVDLGLLLNNFNDETGLITWGGGELDGDGIVNSVDLGLLLNNFNFTSASAVSAVPEPSAFALLLGSVAALAFVRKRR